MQAKIHKLFKVLIALVWMINGLYCKLLNFVPRHEEIVRRILGGEYSVPLTRAIGIAEICMALWILSGIKPKFNAVVQILIITAMNILEFFLAPDLLLWGRANAFFAAAFIILIYINEFHPDRK